MQKLCCVCTRQHPLPVWSHKFVLSSTTHISTNSHPFLVGIISQQLSSGHAINRTHGTSLPMSEEVMAQVNHMERKQGNNPGLLFAGRNEEEMNEQNNKDNDDDSTFDPNDDDNTSHRSVKSSGECNHESEDRDVGIMTTMLK